MKQPLTRSRPASAEERLKELKTLARRPKIVDVEPEEVAAGNDNVAAANENDPTAGGGEITEWTGTEAFPVLPPRGGRVDVGSNPFRGEKVQLERGGDYVQPNTGQRFGPDELVQVIRAWTLCWIMFANGSFKVLQKYEPGRPWPERGDFDPPPPTKPGEADPISQSLYIYIWDSKYDEWMTLYGSGVYLQIAVEKLGTLMRRKRVDYPGAWPIVRFGSVIHPAKAGYSAFAAPVFKVEGWLLPDGSEIEA